MAYAYKKEYGQSSASGSGYAAYRERSSGQSSSTSSTGPPPTPPMCMAVNALKRRICLMSQEDQKRDDAFFFALEPIPDAIFRLFGKKLADSDVDESLDSYVHCDKCDCFYTYSCLEHPLYRALDRPDTGFENTNQRAQKTLPAFLYIGISSIPDAGKGVFSKVDIPMGVVFGPYEGILRRDPKKAECDGYSWEIRRGNVTVYVDGRDPRFANWMRYVNSSREEAEQNLIAFQYAGGVYYRVYRPVDREKELLVWYGAAFGKSLAINTTPQKKRKPLYRSSTKNPYIIE